MMGLTETQKRAYDLIAARLNQTAVAPTLSQLARMLDLRSKGHAHRVVSTLVERGYLRRLPRRKQALELVERPVRFQYFRFDDDAKALVAWEPPTAIPKKRRGGHRVNGAAPVARPMKSTSRGAE